MVKDAKRKTMRAGPFLFTKIGAGFSVVVVVARVATFEPHGGVELSSVFVPLWHLVASEVFSDRAVPALAWYAGVLLHWPALGGVVDVLRALCHTPRLDYPPNKA
jgi:hypothetical protein